MYFNVTWVHAVNLCKRRERRKKTFDTIDNHFPKTRNVSSLKMQTIVKPYMWMFVEYTRRANIHNSYVGNLHEFFPRRYTSVVYIFLYKMNFNYLFCSKHWFSIWTRIIFMFSFCVKGEEEEVLNIIHRF